MSPRENLIANFKVICEEDYFDMFLNKTSQNILEKKLMAFINSIINYINCKNYSCEKLIIKNFSDCICLLFEDTLIRTYTLEQVKTLKNESQLGMALFIEYGYLIKNLKKIQLEQMELKLIL